MAEHMPIDVQSIIGLLDCSIKWKDEHGEPRGHEVYHPSAFGKAQPLDAFIQTPTGPRLMRDLQIGDEVCGVNGDINNILQIHPQGQKKVFRVEFSDGDITECCDDHLWEVDSKYLGFSHPKLLTLKQIRETYIPNNGHRHYQIRMPLPIRVRTGWSSSLQPYTLGALIGDGCFRCGSPMLTNIDEEIVQRVSDELPDGVIIKSRDDKVQHWLSGCKNGRNIVKVELQRLGLWGITTDERFIPGSALFTNETSRWSLLQGLMDTDGTVSKKGHPSFTSVSRILIDQVAWLVKSLGGLTRLYVKNTTFQGKKYGKTAYTLHISHVEPDRMFFLKRKVIRSLLQKGRRVNRNIKNIVELGEKECQCITISNDDGLYLTDNCIVTHNCLRLMQYQRYSERGYMPTPPDPHEPSLCRIFGNGHSMHSRWISYFEEMGVLRGYWMCLNPLCGAFDDNGNYDGVTTISHIMADQKMWYKLRRKHGKDHLQGAFKPDKCNCGWERFKYEETDVIAHELNFHGHADGILDFSSPKFDPDKYMQYRTKSYDFDLNLLPKNPIVVDFKSCNHHDFQEVAKGFPHTEYQVQLALYCNILECEYGLLLYENKNNQKTSCFKVPRSEHDWWPEIVRQASIMNDMVEVEMPDGSIDHLLPPPRPFSVDSTECNRCIYKDVCIESGIWDDPDLEAKRAEFYGRLLHIEGKEH